MHRTRVKVCSICSLADTRLAASAGVDAIGLICHPPARRYVEPATARAIVEALPPFVAAVGVFVNAGAPAMLATARELRLGYVQMHGDETVEDAARLVDDNLRVLKTLKVDATIERVLPEWREAVERRPGLLAGIVLESPGAAGGSGIPNDWAAIQRLQYAGLFGDLRVIVAGGLTPDNVGDVVRQLRPWAVDVSSGVEARLRSKDPEKVARFIAEVRRADAAS
jgi:phosphoribosylanthranilate isomerase